MGLRSILKSSEDEPAPSTRQRLNRDAISALFWIILTALLGIIALSIWGAALRYGLFQGENPVDPSNNSADEALSILGNIGAAAIGGLVGWLTRDQLETKDPAVPAEAAELPEVRTSPYPGEEVIYDELVATAETSPEEQPIVTGGKIDPDAPTHPDELDQDEDPDLVWADEPLDPDEFADDEFADDEATPDDAKGDRS